MGLEIKSIKFTRISYSATEKTDKEKRNEAARKAVEKLERERKEAEKHLTKEQIAQRAEH